MSDGPAVTIDRPAASPPTILSPPSRGLVLRVVIATLLTGGLLWLSRPSEVAAAAARLELWPTLLAVSLVVMDRVLMAARWLLLLAPLDRKRRPPFLVVMRIFFVSTFIGTFLPASVGVDAVRAYSLAREDIAGGDAVASVFVDRMLGALAVVVVGAAGLVASRPIVPAWLVGLGLVLATGATAVAGVILFSQRAGAWAGWATAFLPGAGVRQGATSLVEAVQAYARHPAALAHVFAASLLVQVVRVCQVIALGAGLGITAGAAVYFAYVPAIMLIMLLPVTVAGLGTTQAAFMWFFPHAGVGHAASFALSLLFSALHVVGNVPGAVLLAWQRAPASSVPR